MAVARLQAELLQQQLGQEVLEIRLVAVIQSVYTINQSIRLFQVNKPIATVTVGDRQTDRHKQYIYMQYISKRKTQKHT